MGGENPFFPPMFIMMMALCRRHRKLASDFRIGGSIFGLSGGVTKMGTCQCTVSGIFLLLKKGLRTMPALEKSLRSGILSNKRIA
jgi:hypothetical protein